MGEQQTGAEHGTKQRTKTGVNRCGDRTRNDSPGSPSLGLVWRSDGCSKKLMRASVTTRAGATPAVSTRVVASSTAWGAGRISRAVARAFELIGSREVGGATVEGSDQTNRTRKIFLELSVRCPRPLNLLTQFQKRYFRALKLGDSPKKLQWLPPFCFLVCF